MSDASELDSRARVGAADRAEVEAAEVAGVEGVEAEVEAEVADLRPVPPRSLVRNLY